MITISGFLLGAGALVLVAPGIALGTIYEIGVQTQVGATSATGASSVTGISGTGGATGMA